MQLSSEESKVLELTANSAYMPLQGMRRNPYAPEVPCHRVVSATHALGGFNGSWVSGPWSGIVHAQMPCA